MNTPTSLVVILSLLAVILSFFAVILSLSKDLGDRTVREILRQAQDDRRDGDRTVREILRQAQDDR
jgi:hypothetical protein